MPDNRYRQMWLLRFQSKTAHKQGHNTCPLNSSSSVELFVTGMNLEVSRPVVITRPCVVFLLLFAVLIYSDNATFLVEKY